MQMVQAYPQAVVAWQRWLGSKGDGCDGTHCASTAQWGVRSHRMRTSLKARDGSPAQGVQDAEGGGRLREPNAARPLECPIRTTVETLKGQAPLERATVCPARQRPPLASQTSARGGGGVAGDPPTDTLPQAIATQPRNLESNHQPPKKAISPPFWDRQPRTGPKRRPDGFGGGGDASGRLGSTDCAVGSG